MVPTFFWGTTISSLHSSAARHELGLGKVMGESHALDSAIAFKHLPFKHLQKIDDEMPVELDVHRIFDTSHAASRVASNDGILMTLLISIPALCWNLSSVAFASVFWSPSTTARTSSVPTSGPSSESSHRLPACRMQLVRPTVQMRSRSRYAHSGWRTETRLWCHLHFLSKHLALPHLYLPRSDPHMERRLSVAGSRRMATSDGMLLEGKLTVYDKNRDEDTYSWGEYMLGQTTPGSDEPVAMHIFHPLHQIMRLLDLSC